MYSHWMPQNLQKRLLLYILQQLSLFSEIDLPNLEEVSLNSIHLRDVQIDPDKVGKLPGCTLRSGTLRTIDLSGGVVGGVLFAVLGVELVVAPNIDNLSNNVLFNLAQSTADLANTVMLDADAADDCAVDSGSDLDAPPPPLSRSALVSSSALRRPSALGGVMSRAVEIALLRLQVVVTDVRVKFVLEPADICVLIDEINFASSNGTRLVDVAGVKVSTTKPSVNAGHRAALAPASGAASAADSGSDDDDAYGEESLMDSMVFTHEEASSIYMSATLQRLGGLAAAMPLATDVVMAFVDRIAVRFEGLNPASDLAVDVGTLNVAAVPLAPTAALVFNSIAKIVKLKNHQLRKQKAAARTKHTRFPEYDDSDDAPDDDPDAPLPDAPLFDKLHIAQFELSFTSAISPQGTFASTDDDLSLRCLNLNVKRKGSSLVYGGVEVCEIVKHLHNQLLRVFYFESQNPPPSSDDVSSPPKPQTKAEVRFEYCKNDDASSEFTALLSKAAVCNLDASSLQYLTNFASSVSAVLEGLSGMLSDLAVMNSLKSSLVSKASAAKTQPGASQFVLQTASVVVNLTLPTLDSLKATIFPIAFNKQQNQLSIQRIILSFASGGHELQIITIPSVILRTSPQEFRAYRRHNTSSSPREVTLLASSTLSTGKISGSMEFSAFKRLSKGITSFFSEFSELDKKVNFLSSAFKDSSGPITKTAASSTLANSIYSHQSRFRRMKGAAPTSSALFKEQTSSQASFRLVISLIDFSITRLFKRFGDLTFDISQTELYKLGTGLHGFVASLIINRSHNGLKEVFIEQFSQGQKTSGPMILLNQKSNEKISSTDVIIRRFRIEYYTYWLQLFEKDVTQGHNAEEIAHVAPSGTNGVSKKSDFRITLSDFALGLQPGRLPSKLCIGISKGSMDFTSSREQFYIKSSFRDLSLFLIDDVKLLKEPTSSSSLLGVHNLLISMGYVSVGQINTSHLGITVNTDIEEVKRRNEQLGIRGNLSLVDLKFNSDEHQIDLCADSAHTLLQTINDLKSPVVFKNEEKFRVKVNDGFELPKEILTELTSLAEINSQSIKDQNIARDTSDSQSVNSIPKKGDVRTRAPSEEFFIVDGYYDEPQSPESKLAESISKLGFGESSSDISPEILVVENHFSEKLKPTVIEVFPFSLNVNLSKTKIFLFDGYDWKLTRKSLRKAVKSLETRIAERRLQKQDPVTEVSSSLEKKKVSFQETDHTTLHDAESNVLEEPYDFEPDEEEDEEAYSEILFESIHLTMPADDSTTNLVDAINSQVQFEDTINDSNAQPNINVEKHYKDLKLNRSRFHKVLVDLKNIEVNVTNYTSRDPRFDKTPENLEIEKVNKVEVELDVLDVYDNLPTSSWNKVLTYMSLLGEREIGTSMFHLEIMNVRPDPSLAYAEALINVKILPVRLHVDQDTLMFLMRFGEFKDSRFALPVDEAVFIQKLVIDPLRVRFDYKPKKIDYAGIRSGNSAELVNFFILDGSDISLQKAVVYGVLGYPKLGPSLLRVYAPYIQKYQLAGLLSGLSPVRSIVNLGGGIKDLVAIPVKEYKKDGRLIRSIQKGTKTFAKTTTYELLKLGVKLASGTQVILENLEEFFGGEGTVGRSSKVKKKEVKEDRPKKTTGNKLLESSSILKKTAGFERDPFSSDKLYSVAAIDEHDEDDPALEHMHSSILVFDPANKSGAAEHFLGDEGLESDGTDEEKLEKVVSLYSNQPTNTKEGLKSAYKSMGRNLTSTKKHFSHLKKDLQGAENFQQLISSIAKSSPVLVIRPLIGTTEAMMKALMGLSNEIDSRYVSESQDKYRSERGGSGDA